MRNFFLFVYITLGAINGMCNGVYIPPYARSVSDFLKENETNFNGVIAVRNDSLGNYLNWKGNANLDSLTMFSLKDQFVIGSISKQITAVLILQQLEKNKIVLQEKIGAYLPNLNQPWKNQVTVHQLLVHTHGIVASDKPLNIAAGKEFHYSQYGYHLLAEILENVTGKSFEELSQQLFEAVGMKETYHPDRKEYQNLVNGYVENEKGELTEATEHLRNYPAAGSFISTVTDLLLWTDKLHNNEIVSSSTLKLMKTNFETRKHPIFGEIQYGYGLTFFENEQDIMIGALGYAEGFVSACFYFPQTGTTVAILQNIARGLFDFKKVFYSTTKILKLLKKEGL